MTSAPPQDNSRALNYNPENVLFDTQVEKVGNFWLGPDNIMPQGFIMEFDKLISVDHFELRNGESKGWASGTQGGNSIGKKSSRKSS